MNTSTPYLVNEDKNSEINSLELPHSIEAEQQLRKTGRIMIYKNEDGDVKHSQIVPMQTISKQALESAIKISSLFGLNPAARTKISAPAKLEIKDNEFNFFND